MLMAGIMIGKAAWPVIEWQAWCASCVLVTALAFLLREKICQTALSFLATILLGSMVTSHHLSELQVALPQGEVEYQAIVMSQPVEKQKTLVCDLLVPRGIGTRPTLIKASIMKDTLTHDYLSLRPGDGIWAYGSIESPKPFHEKSNFNYPLWLQAHGYVAHSFIYQENWARIAPDITPLNAWQRTQVKAIRLREKLLSGLRQKGVEGQEMAIVAAMALGEKSMLSQDTKSHYSATGVSHVLSLSGLHLGIIFQIIVLLTGKGRRKPLKTFCSLLAIWVYTVLVGMSASVIRSAVMISIYAFACLLRRDSMSVNSLSLAAIIMLLANPLCLYDISFQLSYLAVAAIILWGVPLCRRLRSRWRGVNLLVDSVVVSLVATVATAPLVAHTFGLLSLSGLVVNPVAVLLGGVVVTGSLLWLLFPFGVLRPLLSALLTAAAEGLDGLVAAAAAWRWGAVEVSLPGGAAAALYALMAAATLWDACRKPKKTLTLPR